MATIRAFFRFLVEEELAESKLAIAWPQMYVLHERGALAGPQYAEFNALAGQVLAWTADSLHTDLT